MSPTRESLRRISIWSAVSRAEKASMLESGFSEPMGPTWSVNDRNTAASTSPSSPTNTSTGASGSAAIAILTSSATRSPSMSEPEVENRAVGAPSPVPTPADDAPAATTVPAVNTSIKTTDSRRRILKTLPAGPSHLHADRGVLAPTTPQSTRTSSAVSPARTPSPSGSTANASAVAMANS